MDVPESVWATVFTASTGTKCSLYVVNHKPTIASVNFALVGEDQTDVVLSDYFITNAAIEGNSYRVFKDILVETALTLAVASEDSGLTLTVLGELF